jgi:CubicO group peptidase (beta-lactamase class C family)
MLLNEGELYGARILSPSSVRLMTLNHVGDLYARYYPGMGFGFNVEVKLDPAVEGYEVPALASPGAYGWGGAAYTRFWVDPSQGLVGVFMTQTRPTSGDLHRKFGNIVYGAVVSPVQ